MTLLWTLTVPRALGPAGWGLIVSGLAVSGVLGILLDVGTRSYLVRATVTDFAEGPALVGTAIVLRLIAVPLVAVGVAVFADLAHYGQEARIVLYLAAATTVLTLLAEPMQAAFQAMERMRYLAYTSVISKTAQSLIGIVLVVLGFRTIGIVVNMTAIAAALVVLNVLWLRPYMGIKVTANLRMVAGMAKQSFVFWASGLFGLIYMWIDTIMLSLMTEPRVVGWYGASTTLLQTLMFLPVLMSTAWLPRLVTAFEQSHRQLMKLGRAPLEFVLVVSIPIATATALAAPLMVAGFYGPAFHHAVPVMVTLALCIPPLYMNIMLSQIAIAANRQAIWTGLMVISAILNPVLNLILIPATQSRFHNGAIGAGVALLVTELLTDLVGFVVVGRQLFDRGTLRRLALVTAASAAMFGVTRAAEPITGLLVALLAGAATFVLLSFKLHIATSDERAIVQAGIARLRQRLLSQPG